MNLEKKINEVDDRKWEFLIMTVQIIFTVMIIVFVFVAFQTQAEVKEFKEQVSQGNCSGLTFQNDSGLEQDLDFTVNDTSYPAPRNVDPGT